MNAIFQLENVTEETVA